MKGMDPAKMEGEDAADKKIEVDTREIYFLIMHFLWGGPCHRATGQLWNELLQHKLLPRRYHSWYSRQGKPSGDEDDDGASLPLSYSQVAERYPYIERNHLVKLLEQLLLNAKANGTGNVTAADVPTLLGTGRFSLLDCNHREPKASHFQRMQFRWPYWKTDELRGLLLRELGGGFVQHHRSPAVRAANCALAKPAVLVDRIQNVKMVRGHRNAVYCAIFDRSGELMITGSDDQLVKLWSIESGFCLRSCRGHEGDITDLAVSIDNNLVASASNDCTICVWRLPDGIPVSILRGHAGAVTAIAFSPRQGCEHHLLSSSDDGTCRIWDACNQSVNPQVYMPKADTDSNPTGPNPSAIQYVNQMLCCAFNADGTIFVTGSSDRLARVWDASKWIDEINGRPNHEVATLKGHENDVTHVQFSGCVIPVRPLPADMTREEQFSKFKNSWLSHDKIVTCSRDGSAIIWTTHPQKYNGKIRLWSKAYHLRVPPPPTPTQIPKGGGPCQRLLPTLRGVNMVVWSLDSRFVLAAIMDCRICVWNAVDGSLVHFLTGHYKSTYVLDVHPFNPRIAMSAGYDGRVIIWDIWEGIPVHTYNIGDFKAVDGNFSPDGTSIVISDEVGQIYLLATGQGQSQKDAKYDQFFLEDFKPLVRDAHGNFFDQETQLPPHERNLQDQLCDAYMIPYPEPYQSMYQQRRLGYLGIDWKPAVCSLGRPTNDATNNPPEILTLPSLDDSSNDRGGRTRWVEQPNELPVIMDWQQDMERVTDCSISDCSASEESLSDADTKQNLSNTECSMYGKEKLTREGYNEETNLRRSTRNKRKAEEFFISSLRTLVKRKAVDNRCESSQGVQHQMLIVPDDPLYSTLSQPVLQSVQLGRPKRMASKSAPYSTSDIVDHVQEDDEGQGTLVTEKDVHDCGDHKDKFNNLTDKGAVETVKQEISKLSEFSRHPRSHRNPLTNIQGYKHGMVENNSSLSHQMCIIPETAMQLGGKVSGHKVCPVHSTVREKQTKKSISLSHSIILHSKEMKRYPCIKENRSSFSVESRNGNLNQSLQGITKILREELEEEIISCKSGKKGRCSNPTITDFCSSENDTSSANDHSTKVFQRQKDTLFEHKSIKIPVIDIFDVREKGKRSEAAYTRGNMVCKEDSFAYSRDAEVGKFAEKTNRFKEGIVQMKPELKITESFKNEFKCNEWLPKAFYHSIFHDSFSKAIAEQSKNIYDANETKTQFPRHLFHVNRRSSLDQSQYVVSTVPSVLMQSDARNSEFGLDDMNLQIMEKGTKGVEVTSKHEEQEYSDFSQFLEGKEHISRDFMKNEKHTRNLPASQPAEATKDIFNNCHTGSGMEEMLMKHSVPCSDSEIQAAGSQSIEFTNSGDCFDKRHEPSRSWSSSGRESAEESTMEACINFRCKERTLGELQSSLKKRHINYSGQGSHNDGSTTKRKVRYLRSLTSQYGKKKKSRRKGRMASINKVNDLTGKHKGQTRLERDYCDVNLFHKNQGRYRRSSDEESSEREKEREVISFESQRRVALLDKANEEVGTTQRRKGIRQSERVKHDISKKGKIFGVTQENRPVTKPLSGGKRKEMSWLMLTEVEEGGRYIPQLGDEVAYLRQGHEEFLESRKLDEKGPWKIFNSSVRAVEFCRILDVGYVIQSHMGDTGCLLNLQFCDDSSDLYGSTFQLNLPELINFPDFLVERTQYDASIARNWTNRDKCKIWWQSENGNVGSWWEARVIAVKPKSRRFPGSPWDQIVVQYKADTSGPHRHSPWELVDRHCQRCESPCMDHVTKAHFLSCIQKLECTNMPEDKYGMRELQRLSSRPDFVNRTPLPLTLDIIKLRLIKDYYRSSQAFKHDVHVLVSNARNYFGSENEITHKVDYLATNITNIFFPPELYDSGSQTDGTDEALKNLDF